MKRLRISFIFLILVSLVNIFPLWIIAKQALTKEAESLAWPLTFLPHTLEFGNLNLFFQTSQIVKGLGISIFVSLTVSVISVILGSLCGWAMARSRKLAARTSVFLIIARMFPVVTLAIPLAVIFIKMGLYNHPLGIGLIFAHTLFVLPFVVLISFSTFKGIPKDLEEQAQIDGCSLFGAFLRITLPVSRAGLASAFILSFILSWNEFGYSLLLQLTNRNLAPLLYYYSSFGSVGISSAISLIMLVPAIAILLFFQHHISSNYLGSAVKY